MQSITGGRRRRDRHPPPRHDPRLRHAQRAPRNIRRPGSDHRGDHLPEQGDRHARLTRERLFALSIGRNSLSVRRLDSGAPDPPKRASRRVPPRARIEGSTLARRASAGSSRPAPKRAAHPSEIRRQLQDLRRRTTRAVGDPGSMRVLRRDLRCRVCGYGIVIAGSPPPCPVCRSKTWVPVARRRRGD
jgi:hypothetical protein